MQDSLTQFLAWMQTHHDTIMDQEKKAKACLQANDVAGYQSAMRKKAEMLSTLPKDAKDSLMPVQGEVKSAIMRRLMRFAQSAAFGLQLNSVFYYSALLYRDDHGIDEPDNLQQFIDEVRKKGDAFEE